MQFVTTKVAFEENPTNLAPRMPWPRDRSFYTSQISKPTYTSREPLPVQLTLSGNELDVPLNPPHSPKRKFSKKSEATQLAEQEKFNSHKKESCGNIFNLSAKLWFWNDQLTLVLDPLNRPREVSKKHQRRRSSVLRALGKGGIPADASVDHKRKSSLLSLLDEPASTEQQNVRRRGSILEAIKRRSSSSNDSHTTAVDEESEQVEGLGEQAQQQEEEKGPTFNLNWYETGDETHKDDEHQGTQKPRRWSTQDTDLAQHKPFPLYINDQALTSINIPFSKITSIHTTQLKRDKSTTITPPGSPNSRKASVAFEQPETPLNEKEKAHEKSIPSEGSRKIASKPATIEIEVHDPSNTRHNQSNGTVSFEFWDTLSGQVEADIVLKYIDMVRKNNNQAPQDIKRAAKDLVQSKERTHERNPIA
ncbi:hypothetical protein E3P96_02534 [Wallemia ichthyophaga]|nr:hypothetical protein E3P96_02534 [Wallemia ichthyophaga]